MTKTSIARMVWPEVQEALDRRAVVLLPLASIEPSGRHSVMGGEQFIAEYFTDRVAQQTDAIWLPTVPFGYAPDFMGFPGAISVRPATLAALLEDTVRSLLHHGFDHIMFVDNHTGNEPIVEQVARLIRADTGVTLANIWLPPVMQAVAKDLYADLKSVHGHGGEPGVSTRLYLCPDDMRLDLAVKSELKEYHGLDVVGKTVKQGPASWAFYVPFHETHPSGGSGHPFDADPERGRIILDRMVDWGVQAVERFKGVRTRHSDQ